MPKNIWLLDSGHGGVIGGEYVTAPKKMFTFDDGLVIYEGVINRQIRAKLIDKLIDTDIGYFIVNHGNVDTPLRERVDFANDLHKQHGNCVYLSIHSNAGGGAGTGFEVFTSPGETASDNIATVFCDQYEEDFPEFRQRQDHTDGDPDKEAHFYVLKKTDCPSILVENLFFDNRRDAEFLLSEEGQDRIADSLFKAIQKWESL